MFFFLISVPKCIELNSESGSRWVLGLVVSPDPRPKFLLGLMSDYNYFYIINCGYNYAKYFFTILAKYGKLLSSFLWSLEINVTLNCNCSLVTNLVHIYNYDYNYFKKIQSQLQSQFNWTTMLLGFFQTCT